MTRGPNFFKCTVVFWVTRVWFRSYVKKCHKQVIGVYILYRYKKGIEVAYDYSLW